MHLRTFSFCLFFLVIQAFVFTGIVNIDFTPMMQTINQPIPNMAELGTPWYSGGIFTDMGTALGWIGQIIAWFFSKIYAVFSIFALLIVPSLEGALMFVSITNICLVVLMILSVVSIG